MIIKIFSIIHKTLFTFLVSLIVLVSLFFVFLLIRQNNLPVNGFVSSIFAIHNNKWDVKIGKTGIVSFNELGHFNLDLRVDNIHFFDKIDSKKYVHIDRVLIRVSLLDAIFRKSFIRHIYIQEIVVKGVAQKDLDKCGVCGLVNGFVSLGKNLPDYLDIFYRYTKTTSGSYVYIDKILLPINNAELNSLRIKPFIGTHDLKNFYLTLLFNNKENISGHLVLNKDLIHKIFLRAQNFDSRAYTDLFNYSSDMGYLTAKSLDVVFKYNDYLTTMDKINIIATNANGGFDSFFVQDKYNDFSNGKLNIEILNDNVIIFNNSSMIVEERSIFLDGLVDLCNERISVEVSTKDLPFSLLYQYTPYGLSKLHDWLEKHIFDTYIDQFVISFELLDFEGLSKEKIVSSLEIKSLFRDSEAVIDISDDKKLLLKNIEGGYYMRHNSSFIDIDRIESKDMIASGSIDIPDHSKLGLDIVFDFDSSAANAIEKFMEYGNIDFKYKNTLLKAEGDCAGSAMFHVPIYEEGMFFRLKSKFSSFNIDNFIAPLGFYSDNIRLVASNDGVFISGDGQINDMDASFDFIKNKNVSKLEVSSLLKSSDVAKIESVSDIIGNMANINGNLRLDFTMNDISTNHFDLFGTIDLQETDMDFLYLKSKKEAGKNASIDFIAALDKNKIKINKALYECDDMILSVDNGHFSVDKNKKDLSIVVKIKPSSRYDFTLYLNENNKNKTIKLLADRFDGSSKHLLSTIFHGHPNKGKDPANVIVEIKNLLMQNNVAITNFSLDSKCGIYGCHWADLEFKFVDGKYVEAGYDEEKLCAKTDNIELLSKAIGFAGLVEGGKAMMCIESFITEDHPKLSGKIVANGLYIRKGGLVSDVLASDKSLATVNEKIEKAQNKKVVEFEKMSSKFDYVDGVVYFKNGVFYSPLIGVTFNGSINVASKRLNIYGSLLPIYGLNSMISYFPILGEFMAGGRGGAFGIDYSIKGELENPALSVNPLSIFVPGFLRNIFDSFRKN